MPLTYLIKGKRSYFTTFGCLMSFLLLSVLLISFFQSDLFLKQHPIISSLPIADATRPYLHFDRSNMTFAFRVVTNDNSIAEIDPTYFSIQITNEVVNNTSHEVIAIDTKTTKLCEADDFADPSYFINYSITNATCINGNSSFVIGGYWTDPMLSYVRVFMNPCKNGTVNGVVCKTPDEIMSYFENRSFYVYYNDRNYDLNNFQNPIKNYYNTQYQMTDASIRKRMILYFNEVQFINDDGLVFENNAVEESFAFNKMESDFTMDSSDCIFEIDIFSSRQTQVMIRRYEKLMAAFAYLGGLGNMLICLELIIVMNVREYSLMKRLVNFLYSFPMMKTPPKMECPLEDNDLNIKINPIETIEILMKNIPTTEKISTEIPQRKFFNMPLLQKDLMEDSTPDLQLDEKEFSLRDKNGANPLEECPHNKDNPLAIPNENSGINIILDKKKETKPKINKKSSSFKIKNEELETFENFAQFQTKENAKYKLDISYCDYLFYKMSHFFKCMRRNRVQKLYGEAHSRALVEMDFFMILRKIQEIEKIKQILFSPQQINVFNLLSKPMVFAENENSDMMKSKNEFKMTLMLEMAKKVSDKDTMKEVLDYYLILKENKRSEIDERLLAMVDRSLEEFGKHYKP